MGATLSKLWGSLKQALSGSSSTAAGSTGNGHQKDVEAQHPAKDPLAKDPPAKDLPATPAKMSVKKYEIKEPWLKLNCGLGEGPFWEEDTNTVRFLDVEHCRMHRVHLDDPASHVVFASPGFPIGCTADIQDNTTDFIFGGKFGYGVMNRQTGAHRWIKKVWSAEETQAGKPDRMRGNDGAVDSQGRFWVGFMFDHAVDPKMNNHGAIFRLDADGSLHRPLSDITIPNGTTWNKQDDTMFFADSPFKTIYQFAYDPATGAISDRKPFFVMPEDNRYGPDAVPDGHCIDEEGYMWTALHGGGHVLRISPAGEIVAEIKVPTAQPTCPCFVGEELVITSAGGTAGEGGKGIDEFAGSVFRINVGVRGLRRFKWKGGEGLEGGKEGGEVVAE